MRLFDAHNHLQDADLDGVRAEFLRGGAVAGMVVNGTGEDDWEAVARLAAENPGVRASYGVHPWRVDEATPAWEDRLRGWLDGGGHVGEIGLDRWRTTENFPRQLAMFRRQFRIGVEWERAITVHGLRAWGPLAEEIRALPRPGRGWLLHAYGGPPEMVPGFAAAGAYFSFSGSFLNAGRERKRAAFLVVPRDRLLVETDAPAMALELGLARHPLSVAGRAVHHPADLAVAYEGLARLRGMAVAELAEIVAENYARLFGS